MNKLKIDVSVDSSDSLKVKNPTSLYAKAPHVYVRKSTGVFANFRLISASILLGLYYGFPWITWNGNQAVLFDMPARKFHYFGLTLWPQDFIYLSWLLIIAALTLFFFTSVAGRLWCGFACPQTVWTKTFLWIERVIEGNRNKRLKLDKSPWSVRKVWIKSFKHFCWLTFALFTGFTFVGYFSPIRELTLALSDFSFGGWEAFWILFYSFATYGNAGWLREQVCIYMCPYARFQSAMFDEDTMIIAYDKNRGESRGSRKKVDTEYKLKGLGDCIDCEQCVHVCPTGIDIREGLQYECIACAACIDTCDSVMKKMNYPTGLIKYTTDNEDAGKGQNVIRPKTVLYAFVLLSIFVAFIVSLKNRIPLETDIIRDRSSLYTYTVDGLIENVYSIKILNMSQKEMTYTISTSGLELINFLGKKEVVVKSGGIMTVPVRLQVDPEILKKTSTTILFHTISKSDPSIITESESRFLAPSADL
ncbi:MAG: cytochrome c oxidase accessory protein FixG [Enterobacterales bacterium]|jgi:cytochrome c oxidase accessory protein FixG